MSPSADAQSARIMQSLNVAGIAILIFDYFLTLDLEVSLIWKLLWKGIIKPIFFLTRYLPFLSSFILLYGQFSQGTTVASCISIYRSHTLICIGGVAIAHVIPTYRALQVWEKSGRLASTVWIFLAFVAAAAILVAVISFKFFTLAVPPHTWPLYSGCFASEIRSEIFIVFVAWILFMIYDCIILGAMVIRWYYAFTLGGQSHLRQMVHKDGIMYFIFLSILPPINVTLLLSLPLKHVNTLTMFEFALISVITCRLATHMILQSKKEEVEFLKRQNHQTFAEKLRMLYQSQFDAAHCSSDGHGRNVGTAGSV